MKHYIFDGKTYDRLPDPFRGCSPMTDARFVELGGTVKVTFFYINFGSCKNTAYCKI